nr:hypothetical protein Ade03nite_95020 [Actinoplanes derwentensis]
MKPSVDEGGKASTDANPSVDEGGNTDPEPLAVLEDDRCVGAFWNFLRASSKAVPLLGISSSSLLAETDDDALADPDVSPADVTPGR